MIIDRLLNDLGLTEKFVIGLARSASYEYKVYNIPKRTGGFRTIHHPSRRLKSLQRWFLTNVIDLLPMHPAAMAYRRGVSIMENATRHASSRYLLRMDLVNFFPSITVEDVTCYMVDHPSLFVGWNQQDCDVFCSVVSLHGRLTIGSPTSPAFSNAICYELDSKLTDLSASCDVTYTRYADDLFFSTLSPGILKPLEAQVVETISTLGVPRNVTVNAAKTRHSSKRRARRVTGIVLGSDGAPHVGRQRKRMIRSLIHRFDSLDDAARNSLAGLLAYAIGFDPQFENDLIQKYGPSKVRLAMTGGG